MTKYLPTHTDAARDGRPNTRRLSDKIRDAFHGACSDQDLATAEQLLGVMERTIKLPSMLPAGVERRKPESLAGASERLWNLRTFRHFGLGPAAL